MATSAFFNAFTNESSDKPPKGMTFTENGALAHDGTGVKCLDFYTKVMARDKATAMKDPIIEDFISQAWLENPAITLRLVANLRDIRGDTGKGERHAATVCWKWLMKNHPEQISANMAHIPFFGRWKDLLDIFATPDTAGQYVELEQAMYDMYAEQLERDRLEYLNGYRSEDPVERAEFYGKVSLAAKWAPSEGCHYDTELKKAGMVPASHRLAMALRDKSYQDSLTGKGLMMWYRKNYLSPLRKVTDIVENHLCQHNFDKIDFSKVPGVALKIYSRKTFPDPKRPELAARFAQWQKDVLAGKAKINSGTVDPYEVVHQMYHGAVTAQLPTLEAFYQSHVAQLRAKLAKKYGSESAIPSTVYVADVSGSMEGIPMIVAIAMAIWGSASTNPAWRDLFFTFETKPTTVRLDDCPTLESRVLKTRQASWGGSTDLQATMDLILSTAQRAGLTDDQMPRRLVIVSDMQFNVACGHNIFTNLEVMSGKFRKAGYTMPIIVFWNVRGNTGPNGAPATATDKGVIMVSGFAKSLLTLIMEGDESNIPTPVDIMLKALSDPRYDRLTLVS